MRILSFQFAVIGFRRHKPGFAKEFQGVLLALFFLCASAGFSQTAGSDSKENASAPVETSKVQTPQEKELADDTAHLLVLANELKVELDKSSRDTLSLSVIKKADAVEKLARKVKEEIKRSLGN